MRALHRYLDFTGSEDIREDLGNTPNYPRQMRLGENLHDLHRRQSDYIRSASLIREEVREEERNA